MTSTATTSPFTLAVECLDVGAGMSILAAKDAAACDRQVSLLNRLMQTCAAKTNDGGGAADFVAWLKCSTLLGVKDVFGIPGDDPSAAIAVLVNAADEHGLGPVGAAAASSGSQPHAINITSIYGAVATGTGGCASIVASIEAMADAFAAGGVFRACEITTPTSTPTSTPTTSATTTTECENVKFAEKTRTDKFGGRFTASVTLHTQ